jgi:hypothetical protein
MDQKRRKEMELKFRDSAGNERRFSPARDIAFAWPYIVASALEGLQETKFDDVLKKLVTEKNHTVADLMSVAVDYIRFCEESLNPAIRHPFEGLVRVGFFRHPPELIVAWFYRLAIVLTGFFFSGIKSATLAGTIPPEIEYLIDVANELKEKFNLNGNFELMDDQARENLDKNKLTEQNCEGGSCTSEQKCCCYGGKTND